MEASLSRTAVTSNRRKVTRYEREIPITLSDLRRSPIEGHPDTMDISTRGMGFQVVHDVKPGEILSFRLLLPAGPVSGQACVRWVQPHHLGYQCGAEIRNLSWLHARRLRLYLEPDSFDIVRVFETGVKIAVLLLAYYVVLDYFELPINPFIWLGNVLQGP
jgi:hypothetical protein